MRHPAYLSAMTQPTATKLLQDLERNIGLPLFDRGRRGMKQAADLKDFRVGLLLPNSRINTSPADYRVVTYMQLQRFNGMSWDYVK